MKRTVVNLILSFFIFFSSISCIKDFPNNSWANLLILASLFNNPQNPTTVIPTPAGAGVVLSTYSTVTEEDQTAPSSSFTVVLSKAPASGTSVSIPVSSTNTAEGVVGQTNGAWVPSFNLVFDNVCPGANCWDTPQTVFVKGVDDAFLDANLYTAYSINLAAVITTDPDYTAYNPPDVVSYNLDNEAVIAPVSALVSVNSIVTTEEQSNPSSSFTVVLDTAPAAGATVSIPVSSSNTVEGGRVGQTDGAWVASFNLVFDDVCPGPNCWNTPQTVFVKGVDDGVVDASSFFAYSIVLGAAVSGDSRFSGYNAPDVSAYNIDNDSPGAAGITVVPSTGLFTTESGGADQFGVVLNKAPAAGTSVTINLSSSNTAEGTVSLAALSFDDACPGANCWYTPKIVTVTGVDDVSPSIDIDTPYTVDLDASASSDSAYAALTPAGSPIQINLFNKDNDAAGISLSTASVGTVELGAPQVFTAVLDTAPQAGTAVFINVTGTDGTEGTVSPAALSFDNICPGPNCWSTPQAVTVTPVDDTAIDGSINYDVILAVDTGLTTDAAYDLLPNSKITVTNSDNEGAPGFTFSAVSGLSVSETGTTASFTITLNTEPLSPVMIALSSSDTGEAVISPSFLTFDSTNWNNAASHTVTVTGVDDPAADGNTAWTVFTSAAVSGDVSYSGIDPSDVTGSTVDNDLPGITWFDTAGKSVSEAGAIDNFSLVLNTEPTGTVIINFSVPATTPLHQRIYTPASGWTTSLSITFDQTNWFVPQTIIIGSVQDSSMERANPSASDPVFNVSYGSPTGTDTSGYTSIVAGSIPVTNIEDEKFIFVTKDALVTTGTHNGSFDTDPALNGGYWGAVNNDANGLAEIDNYCMLNAPPAPAGGYKALVNGTVGRRSSSNPNAGDGQTGWILGKDRTYYRSSDNAFIMTTNINSLFIFGTLAATFSAANHKYVWSGINSDWTYSGNSCNTWSSGGAPQGDTSFSGGKSLNDGTGVYTCGAANTFPAEVICVEQ